MNKSSKDKVVLVVGGAGSIGAVSAKRFAELGARIAISHRHVPDETAAAATVVQSLPGDGHAALIADVAQTATLKALRAEIERRFGRLDILVNAAGFTKPVPHADLDALDDDLIDRMFAVNWRGQFAAIRTFAPLLKASGDGLVVSISSIAATNGIGSSIAYCAVKAGIDVMTKSLARVLAPEVRVLAVAPGVVDTGFVPGRGADFNAKTATTTPLKRIATAEDIASAILACATQLGFATGTTFVVDGGRSL
ncbi:SDR family oxidoreductase [Bradyrhizobium sp. Pear77]|uniref:SDR family NAD(P)-dependent oxidoreductase n=1 Tax=Bradyrhizobium altum TaxID=1571202 RepID=UPI001E4E6C38|nr:SDR family oxidoreductase [Bradyrhizobium altum]MCC8957407.1 SDR family oxidoreductase [Bradyrhizobium altum]